jgi:hypothetical protein
MNKDVVRVAFPSPHSLPTVTHTWVVALLCAALPVGCQPVMSTPTMSGHDNGQSIDETYTDRASDWPLKFRGHWFDAYSFSTYGCKIFYRGMLRVDDPDDVLQPSSEALGDKYPNILAAGMGPITNFPPPAKVTWRARDGTPLEADVDIGWIFKDQLIRHNLKRDEIAEEGIGPGAIPEIILEVNDRTINVYMRAHISTKALQKPGNRYSDFRNDLIKVYSHTY